MKLKILMIAIVLTLLGIGLVVWRHQPTKATVVSPYSSGSNNTTANTKPAATQPTFDKKQRSIDDPTSIWVVVNKIRSLPDGYAPSDLTTPDVPLRLKPGADEMKMRKEAGLALKELVTAAAAEKNNLRLESGYRSQGVQQAVHDQYVRQKGAAAADTDSARAGYSEHQTGLAVDVGRTDGKCQLDACFGTTPEGLWLANNAYEFGFIIRYPQGAQATTGYVYEPWHIRYLGKDLAKAVYDSKQTVEDFFNLPAAPDYK